MMVTDMGVAGKLITGNMPHFCADCASGDPLSCKLVSLRNPQHRLQCIPIPEDDSVANRLHRVPPVLARENPTAGGMKKGAVGVFDVDGDATCQVGVLSRALAFSGVGSAVGTVGVCLLSEAVLPPPFQGPGEDHVVHGPLGAAPTETTLLAERVVRDFTAGAIRSGVCAVRPVGGGRRVVKRTDICPELDEDPEENGEGKGDDEGQMLVFSLDSVDGANALAVYATNVLAAHSSAAGLYITVTTTTTTAEAGAARTTTYLYISTELHSNTDVSPGVTVGVALANLGAKMVGPSDAPKPPTSTHDSCAEREVDLESEEELDAELITRPGRARTHGDGTEDLAEDLLACTHGGNHVRHWCLSWAGCRRPEDVSWEPESKLVSELGMSTFEDMVQKFEDDGGSTVMEDCPSKCQPMPCNSARKKKKSKCQVATKVGADAPLATAEAILTSTRRRLEDKAAKAAAKTRTVTNAYARTHATRADPPLPQQASVTQQPASRSTAAVTQQPASRSTAEWPAAAAGPTAAAQVDVGRGWCCLTAIASRGTGNGSAAATCQLLLDVAGRASAVEGAITVSGARPSQASVDEVKAGLRESATQLKLTASRLLEQVAQCSHDELTAEDSNASQDWNAHDKNRQVIVSENPTHAWGSAWMDSLAAPAIGNRLIVICSRDGVKCDNVRVTTADGKTRQATASKFAREDGDVVLLYINNNHYEIVK